MYLKRGTLYSGQKESEGKPGHSISQLRALLVRWPSDESFNILAPSTSVPWKSAEACCLYAQGHLPSLVTKGGTSPCLQTPGMCSFSHHWAHVTVLLSDLRSVVPGLLLHLQKPRGFYLRGQWAAENTARNSTQSPHPSADPGVHCRGKPSSCSLSGWISLPTLL